MLNVGDMIDYFDVQFLKNNANDILPSRIQKNWV